jgi:hypothetical protein
VVVAVVASVDIEVIRSLDFDGSGGRGVGSSKSDDNVERVGDGGRSCLGDNGRDCIGDVIRVGDDVVGTVYRDCGDLDFGSCGGGEVGIVRRV